MAAAVAPDSRATVAVEGLAWMGMAGRRAGEEGRGRGGGVLLLLLLLLLMLLLLLLLAGPADPLRGGGDGGSFI